MALHWVEDDDVGEDDANMLARAARVVLEQSGRPMAIRRSDSSVGVPGWCLNALELALDGRHRDSRMVIRSHGAIPDMDV